METYEPISEAAEAIAKQIVDSAIAVHRALGPGLLESVYEACLCHELSRRGVRFKRQLDIPVVYEGMRIETGLRIDLLVEHLVVVELKAVEQLTRLFEAQVLIYLKLANKRLGLLINFNTRLLKDGIKRLVT